MPRTLAILGLFLFALLSSSTSWAVGARLYKSGPIQITADGAYDTRRCHNVIAARGAAAVIPPRKNAQLWKPTTAGAIARNEAVRACKYLGRALWRKLTGYHRRSRAETKMNCVKLLGQSLMARDFDRQVAELQVRIAVLNRYTALGMPITEPVE